MGVEALRDLLSSMDELRLWKSTRSLQGEKGVSRDADGLMLMQTRLLHLMRMQMIGWMISVA